MFLAYFPPVRKERQKKMEKEREREEREATFHVRESEISRCALALTLFVALTSLTCRVNQGNDLRMLPLIMARVSELIPLAYANGNKEFGESTRMS